MNDGTWRGMLAAASMAVILCLGAASAGAQDASPVPELAALEGAQVGLFDGACDAEMPEPLSDLGVLEHRPVVSASATPALDGDEQASRDVALIGEDVNGNGVLDEGEDRNGNGVLDEGLLESEAVIPESALGLSNVAEVWMLESTIEISEDADPGEERAIAVYRGDGGERQILACGVFLTQAPSPVAQPLYVDLAPLDQEDTTYRGLVRLAPRDVGAGSDVEVIMFEIPAAEDVAAAAATPAR